MRATEIDNAKDSRAFQMTKKDAPQLVEDVLFCRGAWSRLTNTAG